MIAKHNSLALSLMVLCATPSAWGEEAASREKESGDKDGAARPHAVQKTDRQKADEALARNMLLFRDRKYAEAERLLRDLLLDEELEPAMRRKALTTLASQIIWSRPLEARQLLEQAQTIPPPSVHALVEAEITMGRVFLMARQPDHALEVWLTTLERKDAHPAHLSAAAHEVGLIYKQKGEIENAMKYFQLAVDNGKRVKYQFDFSASEKALRELGKKN